jgi:hypothetical protein
MEEDKEKQKLIISADMYVRVLIVKQFRKAYRDKDGILLLPPFFFQNRRN